MVNVGLLRRVKAKTKNRGQSCEILGPSAVVGESGRHATSQDDIEPWASRLMTAQ
jgi:hypothetical protein